MTTSTDVTYGEVIHEAVGPHIVLSSDTLGTFMGIPITNTLITSWVVIVFLIVTAWIIRKNLSLVNVRGLQNFVEMLFEYVLDFMEEVLGKRALAIKFFPLLVTIFLFIWVSNWAEFIPGVGSIEYGGHHFLKSVNTDLNVTIALAIIAFSVIEIAGFRALGFGYMKKFINFSGTSIGARALNFFIGLIELVSELARLVSFSFRLFGNVFAGEVLIAVTVFFIPLFLPVPLMMFELFVGFIQAAVFSLLTLFFIKIAMTPMEH